MMGSSHTYDLGAAGAGGGRPAPGAGGGGAQRADIEVALNPEELDLDPAEMAARYEQGVREQQSHLSKDRPVREMVDWAILCCFSEGTCAILLQK